MIRTVPSKPPRNKDSDPEQTEAMDWEKWEGLSKKEREVGSEGVMGVDSKKSKERHVSAMVASFSFCAAV